MQSSIWPTLAGVVILWACVHAWALNLYFGIGWELAWFDSAVFNGWMVVAAVLLAVLTRYIPKAAIYQSITGLGALLAWSATEAAHQTLILITGDSLYLSFLSESIPVRWGLAFFFIAASGMVLLFYNRWKEQLAVQQREADTQGMVREAELQKLQLQLQPHFLFNSLNSINALIMVEPDRAQQMVQQLSDFLRLTLKRSDQPFVTLNQELEYLETYLAIEKVRFGHRLDVDMKIADTARASNIPTLVLQPLLENAIKFGLYGTTGKITIGFTVRVSEEGLNIEIRNPFDTDMQPSTGSGFGLSGLQRRLYLIYARNDLMQIETSNNMFSVKLTIPNRHDVHFNR